MGKFTSDFRILCEYCNKPCHTAEGYYSRPEAILAVRDEKKSSKDKGRGRGKNNEDAGGKG